MAKRPVFVPVFKHEHLVDEVSVEFPWHPGFAPIQKRKNICSMHLAAEEKGLGPLLEVSTKSSEPLGQRLSAFNLQIDSPVGKISLEAAFQGSKVFENGGPFTDIYLIDSPEAKKDLRLRESGNLLGFNYFGSEWSLVPKTAFYDWLYLNALKPHLEFLTRLYIYRGFTDIEYNPEKSINCQARTCALLVSLMKLGAIKDALSSPFHFISLIREDSLRKDHSLDLRQRRLHDE